MKLKPYYLGLVLLILLGLTASSAFGVGTAGTVTGGTFPACVDPANTNTTVKIAGKQVAPGGLVRVPTGTTCLSSETTLNLNSYLKTILVSPGPTNVASGTNLQNAMTAATLGTLIKVEPGTYDLGTTPLTMKQGVDLEGSGERLTTITSQVGSTNYQPSAGTLIITNTSEIRFLTIANTTTTNSITAVYGSGVNSTAKLTNVTIINSGSGGVYSYGLYNYNNSSPALLNTTISVSNGSANNTGISNTLFSSPTVQNSAISVSGGTEYNFGITSNNSSPTIQNTTISVNGGYDTNYGIYNYGGSSPTIQNSTISVIGNSLAHYGIYSTSSSSLTIQNSTISATGNSVSSYGIYNNTNSSIIVQNTTITASGGSSPNYGIYNNSSSPTIQNSTILAGAAGFNYSIYNVSSTSKVASSELGATVSGSGFTCVGDYDTNFAALSPTCQPVP